jgi:hypothetical protein
LKQSYSIYWSHLNCDYLGFHILLLIFILFWFVYLYIIYHLGINSKLLCLYLFGKSHGAQCIGLFWRGVERASQSHRTMLGQHFSMLVYSCILRISSSNPPLANCFIGWRCISFHPSLYFYNGSPFPSLSKTYASFIKLCI